VSRGLRTVFTSFQRLSEARSNMKHLLGIESLTKEELYTYLNNSKSFVEVGTRELKKVPALRGKTIINLFLEPSTRTRASFEIAGKRLSADVVNVGGSDTSTSKGETFLDTAKTLQAMAPDILVVRHKQSGASQFLARYLTGTSVINAGDGMHEHPTQAILDCVTLQQHFHDRADGIEKLKIAIVGDIRHSRVARSNIWAHSLLGNEINLVGPPTLVPDELVSPSCFGAKRFGGKVRIYSDIAQGIEGADVVMCLRMQLERQEDHFVPSLQEYTDEYCITEKRLSRYAPKAVVLHPGPVNRGLEISTEVVDGKRSLIETQVNNGVAVRMAVLFSIATAAKEQDVPEEEAVRLGKVAGE
jgi:aspartate carbamoyltransferase catalytic subunit